MASFYLSTFAEKSASGRAWYPSLEITTNEGEVYKYYVDETGKGQTVQSNNTREGTYEITDVTSISSSYFFVYGADENADDVVKYASTYSGNEKYDIVYVKPGTTRTVSYAYKDNGNTVTDIFTLEFVKDSNTTSLWSYIVNVYKGSVATGNPLASCRYVFFVWDLGGPPFTYNRSTWVTGAISSVGDAFRRKYNVRPEDPQDMTVYNPFQYRLCMCCGTGQGSVAATLLDSNGTVLNFGKITATTPYNKQLGTLPTVNRSIDFRDPNNVYPGFYLWYDDTQNPTECYYSADGANVNYQFAISLDNADRSFPPDTASDSYNSAYVPEMEAGDFSVLGYTPGNTTYQHGGKTYEKVLWNVLKYTETTTVLPPVEGLSLLLDGNVDITNTSYPSVYSASTHTVGVGGTEQGDVISWTVTENGVEGSTTTTTPTFKRAGTYKITAKVAREGHLDGVVTGTLVIERKQLTVPGLTLARFYARNQSVTPKISDTEITPNTNITGSVSGIITGDDVTVTFLSASFRDYHAGEDKPVDISYDVTGDDIANYIAPPATLTGRILAKTINVTVAPVFADKTYDGGTALPLYATPPTVKTWVKTDGDYLSVVPKSTCTLQTPGVGVKSVEVEYDIVFQDGWDETNAPVYPTDYTLSTKSQVNINVIPKTLDVNDVSTITKVYNASKTLSNVSTSGASLTGVITGDQVQIASATATFISANVGTYDDVVVSYTLSGSAAGNYTASRITEGQITAKQVSVSGSPIVVDRYENGKRDATIDTSGLSIPGIESADRDAVVLIATGQFASSAVGTHSVTVTYSLSGIPASNYYLSPNTATAEGTILATPHDYHIQIEYEGNVISETSVPYNGTGNGITLRLMDGDTPVSYTNNIEWYFSNDSDILNNSMQGETFTFDWGGICKVSCRLKNTNNEYVEVDTVSLTLTPLQLSITDPVVADKEYDGTSAVERAFISLGTVSGALPGEESYIQQHLQLFAFYDDKNAGSSKYVTVKYGWGGSEYLPPTDSRVVSRIQKKQLYCSGTTADSKYYDGTDVAKTRVGTVTGAVSGDDINVTALGRFNSSAPSADDDTTDKTVNVTYTLSGRDAGNYIPPATETIQNLTIYNVTVKCSWIAVSYD